MQASVERVVRRFLAAEERFEHPYELRRYLEAHPETGWREAKQQKSRQDSFLKRISGVWMEVSWYSGSGYINIGPTMTPPTVEPADWDAAFEKLNATLPIKGMTLSKIDRQALELAKVYKEMAGPRKKKDTSKVLYLSKGLKGDEAIEAWKRDVEGYLQRTLEEEGRRGRAVNTRYLLKAIKGEFELFADNRFVSRSIQAILNRLLKQDKINQDGDGNWTKW